MTSIAKVDEFQDILSDVESMKGRQDSVDTMLNNMKRENEALWREVAILRQKHMKQQQIVEKLLHFLVSIVQKQMNVNVGGIKRKAPLMIDSSGNQRKILKPNKDNIGMASSPGGSGPVISDITDMEENAGDFGSSFISDIPSNQIISTLQSNRINPGEISLLAPVTDNTNYDNKPAIVLSNLPNSLLDFDLSDIPQQTDDVSSVSQLLDDQISSGLATPKITFEDSPVPIISTDSPASAMQDGLPEVEVVKPSFSTDLVVPNQSASASNANLPTLNNEYL